MTSKWANYAALPGSEHQLERAARGDSVDRAVGGRAKSIIVS
jgi:hypothetical protein